MEQIDWPDFEKVELRIGTILEAQIFPQARKAAYKLKIDFGNFGLKNSSAQITNLYSTEELIGKQIIAVVNFPSKQIGPFRSECLVAGFYNQKGEVVLAVPDKILENGAKLA